MLLHVLVLQSLLLLNNIILHGYTTFCFHSPGDGQFGAIMNTAAVNIIIQIFVWTCALIYL